MKWKQTISHFYGKRIHAFHTFMITFCQQTKFFKHVSCMKGTSVWFNHNSPCLDKAYIYVSYLECAHPVLVRNYCSACSITEYYLAILLVLSN